MHRKIAFYLPRTNHLKVVAPVIDYMLRCCANNFGITVLVPVWKISKPQLQPSPEDISQLFDKQIELKVIENVADFIRIIRENLIEAVVSVAPRLAEIRKYDEANILAESRRFGTKWISLPHSFETDLLIENDPEYLLSYWGNS